MLRRKIKADARTMLRERWFGAPALGCLIYFLLRSISSFAFMQWENNKLNQLKALGWIKKSSEVANPENLFLELKKQLSSIFGWSDLVMGFSSLFALCVLSVLFLGLVRLMFKYMDNTKEGISPLFYYFSSGKRFFSALWLQINIAFRIFLGTLVFLVFTSILGAWWQVVRAAHAPAGRILAMLLAGLSLFGIIGYSIWVCRYFAARVAWVKGDGELSVNKSIKLSVLATKGERWKLFIFHISFILIFLLAIFVITIPFIMEYYLLAGVIYSRYLLERFERPRDKDIQLDEALPEEVVQVQDK